MTVSDPNEPAAPDADGQPNAAGPRLVDRKLLEILVCPLTKGPLRYDTERQELISDKAGLAYPVRDGIPIMLVDEARQIDKHTTA
jgi:uncharacterized protein YbaR (Trm112 family)